MLSEHEKQVLLRNPDLFIATYFPHRIKKLEAFHLRLIRTATTQNRGLILYPAGHGKTTLVSTLLPIWAICENPDVRVSIIAKNEFEAQQIMRALQAELEDNPHLIRDFGPFRDLDNPSKAWALGNLDVAKRTRKGKESTITVFGSGARTVLGYRTDWTVCDDVVTDKNSATPTQRGNLRQWFDLAVETGPEHEHSRLTVVGTLFHPEDLYHDLEEMDDPETGRPIWQRQREDAIVDDENKQPLWPDEWPWGRLMRKKAAIGTLAFLKRYRNIAVDESRMVFRQEYLEGGYVGKVRYPGCVDRTYKVGEKTDSWLVYCGFDPAVGSDRGAKFCAHLTLAVGACDMHERCYWVVDLERDQLTLPQQVETILGKHQEHNAFCSRVEANSYQAGLFQELQRRMVEAGNPLKIEPHYTTRVNKPDPELGVQAMSSAFENGLVHIPWGNPESMRKMKVLVDELIQYPGRTYDTVMAFWFAWLAAQETAPKFRSFNRLQEPRERVWAKLSGRNVWKNPYYERV